MAKFTNCVALCLLLAALVGVMEVESFSEVVDTTSAAEAAAFAGVRKMIDSHVEEGPLDIATTAMYKIFLREFKDRLTLTGTICPETCIIFGCSYTKEYCQCENKFCKENQLDPSAASI